MGAEAVKDLVSRLDLAEVEAELKETISTAKGQRKAKSIKRLKVVSAFNRRDDAGRVVNSPMGMILDVVPVIPPDLRPMVQLDGGRFATSDLNDLYRRVINRNNRLKRLLDLGAPEIIINNEKRMLQEAVDALFDNGRRGRPVTGPGNRALKSLSDMLKGKQGRFRQNLLGKRVDYSGRSVIVVGPQLRLQQCGLPKQMALELFKPFVMKRLVDLEYAQNIKSAKRMVERARPQVWDVLEEVIKEHPVFLNRAPTLHRLGIQAFEPVLVEGKAIQIHPLVCAAFNADFDGDQMAVHLPLSAEAQAEARMLMLSAHNILSPASGRPIAVPSQDMIIGVYYLTEQVDGAGTGRVFSSLNEAVAAYEERYSAAGETVALHTKIKVRMPASKFPVERFERARPKTARRRASCCASTAATARSRCSSSRRSAASCSTTRSPTTSRSSTSTMKKRDITEVVGELVVSYDKAVVADSLDKLKALGYEWSTRAGLTISISDVTTPPAKAGLLEKFEGEAAKVESQYDRGIITDDERRQQEIEIWTDATNQVTKAMQDLMSSTPFNPIDMMVGSGARGNVMQVRQIAGMRGLVANPKGEIIPRPIKSNFREGLSVLEYFISTHGARKGLADTALRTADSGYLTRRLVDVAQELIVREVACDTVRGIWVEDVLPGVESWRLLETSLLGRCLAEDVTLSDGTVITRNTEVDDDVMRLLADDPGITRLRVRSVLTCETVSGVCSACYGRMLATGKISDLGEAIGIVAAQSIGEPGTQLTMRTFHTGGVAGEDITHGLPRVVELFEARTPKSASLMADVSGVARIGENDKGEKVITVVADDGTEFEYAVSRRAHIGVREGQEIQAGDRLVGDEKSPLDPKKLLEIKGVRETQQYLVDEVQRVYRDQGVSIHDKHIEVIVRQMLRRVTVSEPGDSAFLPGEKVDARRYAEENRHARRVEPASGRRSSRAHGDHEGVARDRLVVVGGVVPGDDAGAHRGRDRGSFRRARGPQGERDHRQAHPGRYRHAALPRHQDGCPRLRAAAVLHVGGRRGDGSRNLVARSEHTSRDRTRLRDPRRLPRTANRPAAEHPRRASSPTRSTRSRTSTSATAKPPKATSPEKPPPASSSSALTKGRPQRPALLRSEHGRMERPDTRVIWEANAAAWIELSRAGYDVNRDLVNTPAFFALLPRVEGLFGLDLGCGEGHNTRLLVAEGAEVVALDTSKQFIDAAASESRRGIRFVLADGAILPFGDATFDFVTGFMSLMDVADPEATLREVARVLRPGGFAEFSIVHPMASTRLRRWVVDDAGQREALAIGDYFVEGPVTETWTFGAAPEELRSRHRPFTIVYARSHVHRLVQRVRRRRSRH